jgi:hypothetical protein
MQKQPNPGEWTKRNPPQPIRLLLIDFAMLSIGAHFMPQH